MATNVNKKLEKLNILQWNVQGLKPKALELSSILSEKKISVACLQETLLGDSNWCPTKQYKLEKSSHIGEEQNRGVSISIHATLQYNRVPLHTTLEAAAVTINSTKRYTICSVYLSPNANIDMEELVEESVGCSTRGGLPITTSKETPSQPLTCAFAQLENFGIFSWRWMRTYMGETTFPSI